MIGWTGVGPGSAQSLPRELSLAEDKASLLQRFVPELESLRGPPARVAAGAAVGTSRCEVRAAFDGPGALTLLDDRRGRGVRVTIDEAHVVVDGTSLGSDAPRAGPAPAGPTYVVHAYVDGPIVELIVNNRTAFVVYADPGPANVRVSSTGSLAVWPLADPGHNYTLP